MSDGDEEIRSLISASLDLTEQTSDDADIEGKIMRLRTCHVESDDNSSTAAHVTNPLPGLKVDSGDVARRESFHKDKD